MNTENIETVVVPSETPTQNKSVLSELNETVANMIGRAGERIKNIFIEKQVNDEINRRAGLLANLVTAMTKFKRECNKFKADLLTYNLDGSVASESFSKKVVDERKKALEKLAKAEKILAKAINDNDYSNVEQVTKELSAGGGEKSEST